MAEHIYEKTLAEREHFSPELYKEKSIPTSSDAFKERAKTNKWSSTALWIVLAMDAAVAICSLILATLAYTQGGDVQFETDQISLAAIPNTQMEIALLTEQLNGSQLLLDEVIFATNMSIMNNTGPPGKEV